MKKNFSLKDHLFNPTNVKQLASSIKGVYAKFQQEKFVEQVLKKFSQLELKQRISWISENLKIFLPADFRKATKIILKSLPPECNPHATDNDFGDFIFAPYADFIAQNGCNRLDVHFSLDALKKMTTRFSAEDAIRYFINAFPKETLTVLKKWLKDPHYHVRRLVSEGTRPKLPWAQKIHLDPKESIQLLDQLFNDKTRFVTRSVANHLNDISKSDPNLVLKYLKRWKQSGRQDEKEMQYITNHSLRTLVKKGHSKTMEFLGFSSKPSIRVLNFSMNKEHIRIGEALIFSFEITTQKTENLIIDYKIHFRKKSGGLGEKVHKVKKIQLKKGQQISISKKHTFHKNMTTRKLYEGKHKLEIQINGKVFAKKTFFLMH